MLVYNSPYSTYNAYKMLYNVNYINILLHFIYYYFNFV